jgi:outer membrane protein
VVFKKEAERLLQQAENDAYQPLHQQLKETLAEVSRQQGLAFVLNTDNNTVPFINTAYGTDLTALLINKLK